MNFQEEFHSFFKPHLQGSDSGCSFKAYWLLYKGHVMPNKDFQGSYYECGFMLMWYQTKIFKKIHFFPRFEGSDSECDFMIL